MNYMINATDELVEAQKYAGPSGQIRIDNVDIYVDTGDWLVTMPDGTLTAYTDTAFAEQFTYIGPAVRVLTKLAFRRRFTLSERIAFDNAESSALPAEAKAAIRTMQNDLSVAEEVDLDDPDVVAGLNMLATFGIIASERVAEILA